ncbi:MAG: thermonuclease family protein [Patescibacteria group bacterium]
MTSKKFLKKLVIPLFSLLLGAFVSQTGMLPNTPKTTPDSSVYVTPIPQVKGTYSQTAKVIEVIDGDTFKIESGEKVRMIGIDTPELHHPSKPVQCYAKEALIQTKAIIDGKTVRLVKDISEVDRYGRLLRYVYLPIESTTPTVTQQPTELFVNEYLVREGYAHAVTFPPDISNETLFRQREREAATNKKGLWSNCK